MALYTIAELKEKTKAKLRWSMKTASVTLTEATKEFSESKTYDIFLSHSFSDAEVILGLKYDIEEMGFTVYVDWIEDPELNRNNVTKKTAEVLRSRMKCCKSLFFATSETSPKSKWMPWELGYFDGQKGKVAILPISEASTSTSQYDGQEYLGLYPYVTKYTFILLRNELRIHKDEHTYEDFKVWFEGSKVVYRKL